MGYKLDLHTHSYGSSDGGLRLRDYRYFLENKLLDYIAITDHNRIDTALAIQTDLGELGRYIIIGEEVTTTEGELIGLYLREAVPAGLTPAAAAAAIHAQGGVVYIPHPFETVRSGLNLTSLEAIAGQVDVLETHNGRALLQNRGRQARAWAKAHAKPTVSSSDAHGRFGWGRAYTILEHAPQADTLTRLLGNAVYATGTVGWGVLYPKYNRLRKRLGR